MAGQNPRSLWPGQDFGGRFSEIEVAGRQRSGRVDVDRQIASSIAVRVSPDLVEIAGDVPRVTSCATDECVAQALRAIGWERRDDPAWKQPPDRPNIRRGLGFALCMQATAIPNLDMGGASIKMNDDGSFNLLVGATDLGTGADTVLAQIAAEDVISDADRGDHA